MEPSGKIVNITIETRILPLQTKEFVPHGNISETKPFTTLGLLLKNSPFGTLSDPSIQFFVNVSFFGEFKCFVASRMEAEEKPDHSFGKKLGGGTIHPIGSITTPMGSSDL